MSSYLKKSLKRQLIFNIILGVMFPFLCVMFILFALNREEMKQQAVENVEQRLELAATNIEQLLNNMQNVSNYYAYDASFREYTEKEYGEETMDMIRDIQKISTLFGKSDPLGINVRMSAVINMHGELLNFSDPLMDQSVVIEKLRDMNVGDINNLSKVIWHPLEDNYFVAVPTGDPRQDKVLVGTRRIINVYSGQLNCVQVFVLPEVQIWEKYKDLMAKEYLGEEAVVFLLDANDKIISSSNLSMVTSEDKSTLVEKSLKSYPTGINSSFELVEGGRKYLISKQLIANTQWEIVAIVPLNVVTKSVDTLFLQIIFVLSICTLLCFYIILRISNRFLKPITLLKKSMQDVYDGTMDAYVEMEGEGEIQEMGRYYNSMLHQINQYIKDTIETERKKKQLELEVIMGQVNPHFLYNTLENIVWKSSEAGFPEIGRMAASLGRMYRLSVSGGKVIIRMQQEIEHLMSYISLQRVRYIDRVEFELLVNYEEIRNHMTIKLLLQPAVENCFMYALEGIDHVLKIWVKVKVFKEVIRFEIIDNGIGMDLLHLQKVRKQIEQGASLEEEKVSQKKGTGIGLYSISERIKLYFGKSNAVSIYSRKNKGTVVAITIPRVLSEDKNRL
ncbi:histidine kinase [Lachnospiraceae bacterium OttesenSCG-928-D06]|nr:histidine kinase [Lachnospiraceae bacterium OttesenSCG-928-D06]